MCDTGCNECMWGVRGGVNSRKRKRMYSCIIEDRVMSRCADVCRCADMKRMPRCFMCRCADIKSPGPSSYPVSSKNFNKLLGKREYVVVDGD